MAVESFCPSLSALLFPFYFALPFERSFPLPFGSLPPPFQTGRNVRTSLAKCAFLAVGRLV